MFGQTANVKACGLGISFPIIWENKLNSRHIVHILFMLAIAHALFAYKVLNK